MANATLDKINRFFHRFLHRNAGFHGSVRVNFKNGRAVNADVHKIVKFDNFLDKGAEGVDNTTERHDIDGESQGDTR